MKHLNYFLAICVLVFSSGVSGQDYKLPAYQKFTLRNGLTVYLMEQHDVPMINVSVVIPAGAIFDGDKAGLAALTATALKHGTKKMTRTQIDEELDFVGASVNTYATKEFASITSEFATKDKDQVFSIIHGLLTSPQFDTSEFTKEKKRVLVRLDQAKESPRSVISSSFDKFVFGDHVYGNIVGGTIASVTALTAADLKKFYNDNYHPNGSAISIVGDFDPKQMKTYLTGLLSDWEKGSAPQASAASKPIIAPASSRVLLINKDDAKETTMAVGTTGISRNNPDYVAIEVVNTLFGGRFTSMLNDELRVNSGLTYGAGSRFTTLRNGGSFAIGTFTATKTTEQTIDKMLEVIKKLHTDGISDTALQSAKNYVKGQLPPEYETSGELASLLTQMYWYNFNESFINNFQKNVDGLTLEKTGEIIRDLFPAGQAAICAGGQVSRYQKDRGKVWPGNGSADHGRAEKSFLADEV